MVDQRSYPRGKRPRPGRARGLALPLIALGLATTAGCASTTPELPPPPAKIAEKPTLPSGIPAFAGPRPDIIQPDTIYALPREEVQAFLNYYNDPGNRGASASKRIAKYLTDVTHAFEYEPYPRTAAEVAEDAGGNCLSLANLTTAVARLAGVEVYYQLITDLPVFEKDNNVIVRSVHVRSKLFDPSPAPTAPSRERDAVVPWYQRTGVIIDYFPSGNGRFIRNISAAEFSAMHYRNLAAEAIAVDDYPKAYWLVREAMELVPDDGDSLNMLAIIYRREGDERTAEQVYRYGIQNATSRLALLKNYRLLLREQGREADAKKIDELVDKLNDKDPFDWWFLAEDAYAQENYQDALTYYKRAVKIAPYLHEGYFGMAKTYYQLGDLGLAQSAMRKAIDNAPRRSMRHIYQAKLDVLSGKGQTSAMADSGK